MRGKRKTQKEWDEAAEAQGLRWLEPVRGTKYRARIECLRCGRRWSPQGRLIAEGGGCRPCTQSRQGSRKVSQEVWAERARQVDLVLLEPVVTSKRTVRVRCLVCSHEYDKRRHSFPTERKKGTRCGECAKRRKFQTQEVWDERAAAVGIRWLDGVPDSSIEQPAECLKCGRVWDVKPDNVREGHGCLRCAEMLVTPEEWAESAAAVELEWLEPVKTSHTYTRVRCLKCEREIRPMKPSWVRNQGHGCRSCAKSGMDPEKPGLLYLVRNGWVLKVGITNATDAAESKRLKQHKRAGFEMERIWAFDRTAEAREVEQATLRWWRVDLELPALEMQGPGSTETVDVRMISLAEVIAFVEDQIGSAAED